MRPVDEFSSERCFFIFGKVGLGRFLLLRRPGCPLSDGIFIPLRNYHCLTFIFERSLLNSYLSTFIKFCNSDFTNDYIINDFSIFNDN